MRFEDDVFISYSHQNNESKDDKDKGWVDYFHERLEFQLTEILGYKPKVWRDTRMPGNVYIASHLYQKLSQTRVVVSILSPGYVNSAWCMGELQEFCRLAQENGGLEVDGKQRVFKVVKIPVTGTEPPVVKDQVGFSFYVVNQATQELEEFGYELGANKDQRYWKRLSSLAWAIKNVLVSMNDRTETPHQGMADAFAQVKGRPTKGAIYLAEATSDLHEQREEIKTELEQHDYEVLPDKTLPLVSPDYEQAVEGYLKRARLSVHLLGSRYAITPEGAGNNAAQLQIELAIKPQDQSALSPLIWMSPELQVTDARQHSFIEKLKADSDTQKLAELRIERLEELKTFILKKLEPPPPPPPSKKPAPTTQAGDGANGNGGPVSVYLVYDMDDRDEAMAVEDYLFNQGYEVVSSLNWSPQTHERNLKICDSLLVYHCKSNDGWLHERRADLLQARGLREGKRFYAKAFYLSAPPDTEVKMRFRSNDALVLRSANGFDPSALAAFFDAINGAKGAAI
jgi:hypothetical protein